MDLAPDAKFVYRVTATNQMIKPAPIALRFSRGESGTFCDKVSEVGVNVGSDKLFPGGEAPGTSDRNSVLFRSAVGGAAGLCSFGNQDAVVPLAVPAWIDARVESYLNKQGCVGQSAANRRQPKSYVNEFVTFKPYLKKAGGAYDWKAMANKQCDTQVPFICRVPVEIVCDAVGANQAPVVESTDVTPTSLPGSGGAVKIVAVGADDAGLVKVSVTVSVGGAAPYTRDLSKSADLGVTASGAKRSRWEGTVDIQANPTRTPRTITVNFDFADGENAVAGVGGAGAGKVQQAVVKDLVPPQLLSFTVTPAELPSTGGDVTATVRASDNFGIAPPTLVYTQPDGRTSGLRMPLSGGSAQSGEWKSSWTIPMNPDPTPKMYSLKLTLADVDSNVVAGPTLNIKVAGKTAGPAMPGALPAPTIPRRPPR